MGQRPEVGFTERRNIGFTKPQISTLREIAGQKNVLITVVVRQAVDEYIERWKDRGVAR
jgi:hypothetical protein